MPRLPCFGGIDSIWFDLSHLAILLSFVAGVRLSPNAHGIFSLGVRLSPNTHGHISNGADIQQPDGPLQGIRPCQSCAPFADTSNQTAYRQQSDALQVFDAIKESQGAQPSFLNEDPSKEINRTCCIEKQLTHMAPQVKDSVEESLGNVPAAGHLELSANYLTRIVPQVNKSMKKSVRKATAGGHLKLSEVHLTQMAPQLNESAQESLVNVTAEGKHLVVVESEFTSLVLLLKVVGAVAFAIVAFAIVFRFACKMKARFDLVLEDDSASDKDNDISQEQLSPSMCILADAIEASALVASNSELGAFNTDFIDEDEAAPLGSMQRSQSMPTIIGVLCTGSFSFDTSTHGAYEPVVEESCEPIYNFIFGDHKTLLWSCIALPDIAKQITLPRQSFTGQAILDAIDSVLEPVAEALFEPVAEAFGCEAGHSSSGLPLASLQFSNLWDLHKTPSSHDGSGEHAIGIETTGAAQGGQATEQTTQLEELHVELNGPQLTPDTMLSLLLAKQCDEQVQTATQATTSLDREKNLDREQPAALLVAARTPAATLLPSSPQKALQHASTTSRAEMQIMDNTLEEVLNNRDKGLKDALHEDVTTTWPLLRPKKKDALHEDGTKTLPLLRPKKKAACRKAALKGVTKNAPVLEWFAGPTPALTHHEQLYEENVVTWRKSRVQSICRSSLLRHALEKVAVGDKTQDRIRTGLETLQNMTRLIENKHSAATQDMGSTAIRKLFYDSMPRPYAEILSIDHVYNVERVRHFLQTVASDGGFVETTFYATREDLLLSTLERGIDPSKSTALNVRSAFVGTHAGVAHQQSIPNGNGERFMCVVLVVVGHKRSKIGMDDLSSPRWYSCVDADRLCVSHVIKYKVRQKTTLGQKVARQQTKGRGTANDDRKSSSDQDPFHCKLQSAIKRAAQQRARKGGR